MKLFYLLAFFLICLIVNSCDSIYSDSDYHKLLNYFGKNKTNHFPTDNETINKSIDIIDTFAYYNSESFILHTRNDFNLVKKIKEKYKSFSLIFSQDSCLVAVNDFVTRTNLGPFYAYKSQYCANCKSKFHIVPNFWYTRIADTSTKTKLPNSFDYYILETKSGVYSDKIDTTQSSMPNSILHGYSKGIALDEKRGDVLFWVVIW